MNILKRLNEVFRIETSSKASKETEIEEIKVFSQIAIPKEYIEMIREKSEMEINILNKKYVRIWGAKGCLEMNEAYNIQKYIYRSLAIGDDEDGNAILYANGKNGFGVYVVAFNDLEEEEMIFIAKSLEELLVYAVGIDKIIEL